MTAKPGDIILSVGDYSLAVSPFGREYKVDPIETSRKERSASGKLWVDIISTKRKVTLTYSLIDDSDLQDFVYLYGLQTTLVFTHYVRDSVSPDVFNVSMDSFSQGRLLTGTNGLWTDVVVVLEEI